jgi:histidinol dehydrogenase
MQQYFWQKLGAQERRNLLCRPALSDDSRLQVQVAAIIERVQKSGDAALMALTREFDSVSVPSLLVSEEEFQDAEKLLTDRQKTALEEAAATISVFHKAQLPRNIVVETAPGVICERVARSIDNVGLYVPAGSAPLPSTALMLAIPAKLAGCQTRLLCTPPQSDGRANASVLFAARLCGVQQVFKVGGAQAIAAMAYGTETIPKVQKIFGPGNTWVTAAKALVAQDPLGAARDMPAGPSELLVIADDAANPAFVAADLLSQAEHGADSQVMLVTTSATFCAATLTEVKAQQATLPRRDIVLSSLKHSAAIVVESLDAAIELSNQYAPEHLILQIREPRAYLEQVSAAGSVFLGPWAPESVGDYCSGTNHVLPTYGFACSYSSLGVNDFMRSMTVQELTPEGLSQIGPTAETLADLEGLDAHRRAVSLRLSHIANDSGDTER